MSSSPARYFPGLFARRSPAPDALSEPANGPAAGVGIAESREAEASDEDLILRLQAKDVEALGLLYRRYARLVYSVCARILKDSGEAQDLVHEVFLCLFRKCSTFDPAKGNARSWLIQLTYHKCFDWRNYLKARHGYGEGNGDEDVAGDRPEVTYYSDPADLIVWTARMKAAFRSLSKEQQLTLKLYYFKGCTFHEVARELGYSYGNVKNHFYRGMKRLRCIVFDNTTQRSCQAVDQKTRCEAKDFRR